jgi:hypothetical protein
MVVLGWWVPRWCEVDEGESERVREWERRLDVR